MKYFFAIFSIMIALHTQAQLIVNLQLPSSGIMMKSQLWNISIVNTGNVNVNVKVELVMTDVSNNLRVLAGASKFFMVPKGVKQVQANDVKPITYSAAGSGYNLNNDPEGFLPIGIFNVCYSLTKIEGDGVERLGEECETIEVEPLSPPQLVLPEDSEHIEMSRPLFTWLPPSPFTAFYNLTYDWTLVEIQPSQSAVNAIQENIPVLKQLNLHAANLQYPLSQAPLDSNKLYAWRVTAKSGNYGISNSEVWTFRLKKDTSLSKVAVGTNYFVKTSLTEDAAFTICNGILGYVYINEINDNNLQVKLFDISNSKRKNVQLDSAEALIHLGQNLLTLDLMQNKAMINHHIYLLELTNIKNERWYLKFEYSNPDKN